MRKDVLEPWRDFKLLTAVATHLARNAHLTSVGKGRRSIGLILFEYMCSMADGLLRLAPECIFDLEGRAAARAFPPLAVLTRSLLDGYAQFHFLAAENVTDDERSFRYLICNITDRSREGQIGEGFAEELDGFSGAPAQDDAKQARAKVQQLDEQVKQFRDELLNSPFYREVLCRPCQEFWDKNWRRGYELCRGAIWRRAGIRGLERRSSWLHLSSYVHAGPIAVHELAQTPPGFHLQYVPHWAGCVCLAIKHFLSLFPEREQALALDEREPIRHCAHWVQFVSDTADTTSSECRPSSVGCTACWMRARPT